MDEQPQQKQDDQDNTGFVADYTNQDQTYSNNGLAQPIDPASVSPEQQTVEAVPVEQSTEVSAGEQQSLNPAVDTADKSNTATLPTDASTTENQTASSNETPVEDPAVFEEVGSVDTSTLEEVDTGVDEETLAIDDSFGDLTPDL